MKKFLKDEKGASELWAILTILISAIIVMFYLRIIKSHKENTYTHVENQFNEIKKYFKGDK